MKAIPARWLVYVTLSILWQSTRNKFKSLRVYEMDLKYLNLSLTHRASHTGPRWLPCENPEASLYTSKTNIFGYINTFAFIVLNSVPTTRFEKCSNFWITQKISSKAKVQQIQRDTKSDPSNGTLVRDVNEGPNYILYSTYKTTNDAVTIHKNLINLFQFPQK